MSVSEDKIKSSFYKSMISDMKRDQLLVGSDAAGVAALLLSAVDCSWVKSSIAFTADHLVTVILLSQDAKGWFNNTITKAKNQVNGEFLLDVIVWKGSVIFQLLTSEDKTLLILVEFRRNAIFCFVMPLFYDLIFFHNNYFLPS